MINLENYEIVEKLNDKYLIYNHITTNKKIIIKYTDDFYLYQLEVSILENINKNKLTYYIWENNDLYYICLPYIDVISLLLQIHNTKYTGQEYIYTICPVYLNFYNFIPGYLFNLDILYAGGNSLVYKAMKIDDNEMVAIKLYRYYNMKKFNNEVNILNTPEIKKFKYTSKYIDSGIIQNIPYVITEYIDAISMYIFIKYYNLTFSNVLYYYKKILELVKILHDNNIVHLDLKLDNLIINVKTNDIYILDFDTSFILNNDIDDNSNRNIGTTDTAAPESLREYYNSEYGISYKSDIYSLGIILYMMLENTTIQHNYYNINYEERVLTKEEYSEYFDTLKKNYIDIHINDKIPLHNYLEKLILNMTKYNPFERYDINEVIDYLDRYIVFLKNNIK